MYEFILCIDNDDYKASLIVGKVYQRLSDPKAEEHSLVRVVDEDQTEPEGYLYPASMFVSIELPEVARQALMMSPA
ncbi:MAG TPA: hypothetical protein G4N94_10305 [Caldilineae bacterium]|nr:hypothetical protein [Caldilineae bacterium]